MKSHSGLKKVVKSVRGKKGAVRRSYWVKAPLQQNSERGRALGHGMANLGSALGAHFGAKYGEIAGARMAAQHGIPPTPSRIIGAYGGAHFGNKMGRQAGGIVGSVVARETHMKEHTERNLARAAHFAASGVRLYNLAKAVHGVAQSFRRR